MSLWQRALLGAVATLVQGAALAEPLQRITPQAAYAEIAHSGGLWKKQIDGDLDVAKMKPPPGAKLILLQEVQLEGRLHSSADGPAVALRIDKSRLQKVDLGGSRWSAPLEIESSMVKISTVFENAQFDAAFLLYDTTFDGLARFGGARFAAPVEITRSTFTSSPTGTSYVSFTEARFAAPARFDHSKFLGAGVRFDGSRFAADASFLGVEVTGQASLINVVFRGDAEFRFCRLGDADFGRANEIVQISVFMQMADFRGCTMRSLHLDYADARGDMLLVNVHVAPGDLTLRHASLRGARNDFSGLQVAGRLDLEGAQIANLQLRWFEISDALRRSQPGIAVLGPLQRRLEELKHDEEAREVSAMVAERVIDKRLAPPDMSVDKALAWVERIVWGSATGYGTRLGRIVGVALSCWVVLALPVALVRGVRIGRLLAATDKASPLYHPVAADALQPPPASATARGLQKLAYAFALMFTLPDLRLRPAEPMSAAWLGYLLFMRGAGLGLLVLMALTLANVSPAIQAVLGKIVG